MQQSGANVPRMSRITETTQQLLKDHGPGAIGFYTTGQLFAEEYYTLGLIAHGGIGTKHLDGDTRLCTSTAAAALKETFASDGQPGSYTDVDHADVIALFGHNVAETQSVLWMRVLDRLAGPNPPDIICIDPRPTPVAEQATEICDVPVDQIREAARILGNAKRLLSTVLPGVLSIPPGHSGRSAGQQPQPDSGHGRETRVWHPADERATHRTKHSRMRRRW